MNIEDILLIIASGGMLYVAYELLYLMIYRRIINKKIREIEEGITADDKSLQEF